MNLSDFDFDLPKELIAQYPAQRRDQSKLLKVDDNKFSTHVFSDIVSFFAPGDVLVLNDTKVIPALLKAWKINKIGEKTFFSINLNRQVKADTWSAFIKPARKVEVGTVIFFSKDFKAQVKEKNEGEVLLEFNLIGEDFYSALDLYGAMPLPQYIKRKEELNINVSEVGDNAPENRHNAELDNERYQTVYAKQKGAVAAPTAGLHFTEELLKSIAAKGVDIVYVTLHVGAGTFLPVKSEDISQHKMHSEWIELTAAAAEKINRAQRVVCVGTTALRVLESVANKAACNKDYELQEYRGETDIFITPGYKFKVVDILITNFHLPKSTLFMLVSAFSGLTQMKAAYHFAIEKGFRFFSYGDACWLKRETVLSNFHF